MGKPYSTEVDLLPATYQWALKQPIDELVEAVERAAGLPMLAIGSGGSLTAARYAAALHEALTGRIARHATPVELARASYLDPDSAVFLFTAGGSNPDAVTSLTHAARLEPRLLAALTMKTGTALKRAADRLRLAQVVEYSLPSGKDGFLATNSLLATITLLARAYTAVFRPSTSLPAELSDFVAPSTNWGRWKVPPRPAPSSGVMRL